MAHKRMFSKDITESDAFTDMPLSTQALYFHLGMSADDDGFINNPKRIQRGVGASVDDYNLLVAKNFVIPFKSGVVVIKHWRINNTVRSDRYCPTPYQEEFAQLALKDNKAYTLKNNLPELVVSLVDTVGIPSGYQMETQNRIVEDSIEEKDILSGKPDHASEAAEIVGYLNEATGSSYRPSSKQTMRHINARLKEGYTVDDFKAVIDCKANEWMGGDMAKYLRPETLFSPKFEGYLNQARAEDSKRSRYAKYD